jgi:hypothetical protein
VLASACPLVQAHIASALTGLRPTEINTKLPFCSNSFSPLDNESFPVDSYQNLLFADPSCEMEGDARAITVTSSSVLKVTLTSSSFQMGIHAQPSHLKPPRSPMRSPVLSPSTLSSQLHSAAMGAGLVRKVKKVRNRSFPCMDSYDTPMPGTSDPALPVFLNHIQVDPSTKLYQNPVVTVVPQDKVSLNLAIGEGDKISLSMQVTDGRSNKLVDPSGITVLPPSGPFALKCGKVRRRYRVPFFTSRADWSLRSTYFDEIMDSAQHYDASNGHIFPSQNDWVDAFSDPTGSNAHFQRFWSPVDNAFQHDWHKSNVYAFPPMNDDLLFKTLQYHSVQQSIAAKQGKGFRGIYIVPYQPRSPFWKFTGNFQLLKYYRAGTPMFEAQSKHGGKGKLHSVSAPVPMCVLYDMGYQLPNVHLAYLHAMDLCATALGTTPVDYDLEGDGWDFAPMPSSITTMDVDQCSWNLCPDTCPRGIPLLSSILDDGGGTACPPDMYDPDLDSASDSEEEGIKDITPLSKHFGPTPPKCTPKETWDQNVLFDSPLSHTTGNHGKPVIGDKDKSDSTTLPFINCDENTILDSFINPSYPEAVNRIRIHNMIHCRGPPSTLPEQICTVHDSSAEEAITKLKSAGKLMDMLENDFPEWEEVDQAVKEHVKLLQKMDELPQKPKPEGEDPEPDNNPEVDPQMFDKPWNQGGLLPIGSLRTVSSKGKVVIMDKCVVIKTKVLNKYNTTSLVDGGATDSVLNVDWYTHHGIDWKSLFQVRKGTGEILMADHSSIPTLGSTTLKVELSDCPGKFFTQDFELVNLGPHSYAQILGIDWSNKNRVRNSQPEYSLEFRDLGCTLVAKPMPMHLYQFRVNKATIEGDLPCEEISPAQLTKDIKLMSARLRRLHVYVPPTSFIRQIIVRPAKEEEISQTDNPAPTLWQKDDALEERAAKLRARISLELREQYKDVLDGEPHGLNTAMPHKHIIEVEPGTKPYSRKLKRLSPLEMDLLNHYIQEMVSGGRIRPSSSPWGANVLFVPKPDGTMRCCQDYRELNKVMTQDTYPLPRADVHMDMAQGVFWSKMDLLKGFYQLPMHEDSVKYTAFNTLVGKYEFLVMPMGLQNAPGSFMRAMNLIFEGLMWDPNLRQDCGILVYLDDILIFSQTEEQHMEILRLVLDRLRKHHLQCRFDKCTFAVTEVEYLGFRLSHQGVRMCPKKVQIVKDWPDQPKTKTDIRAFLGIVNYLKRFCKGLSQHSAILSDWSGEKSTCPWTPAHKEALNTIKTLLCSEEVMACPKVDPETKNYFPFTVITDASEIAVGAILLQQQGPSIEDTKVIGYSSSKFKHAERNYSVHEKELMGVLLAVKNWNCFLEGSKFTVKTDHHSLIWLNKLQDPSRRQGRWIDILQGHDFEVLYIKGDTNPADAFTRVPWVDSVVDEDEIPIKQPLVVLRTMKLALQDMGVSIKVSASKLQEWQADTLKLLTEPAKTPPLYRTIMESYALDPNFHSVDWINAQDLNYKDGLFYKDNRVVVPNVLGTKIDVLVEHHDSLMGGHMGIDKTTERIARLFWWPGMHLDIENHVRTCPACQVSKHRNWKPQGHSQGTKPATYPWEVVHLDFAGPFKKRSPGGFNRILIFTDEFTKLSIFVKCRTTLTSAALAELYIQHIWRVYGRVGKLVSDNEPLLCAEAWLKIHERLGTKVTHVSAYNAKANGAAEVLVKQLKAMLTAYERQGLKWWEVLAACERAYNDSVHSSTGYTPFYMTFGRHPLPDIHSLLDGPGQDFVTEFVHWVQSNQAKSHSTVQDILLSNSIKETAKRNARRSPTLDYKVGDIVYLETSALRITPALAPLRSGPYAITQIIASGNAAYLEGFRHPFHVELLTPVLGYASGITPHLTKHLIDLQQPVLPLPLGQAPQLPAVQAHGGGDVAAMEGGAVVLPPAVVQNDEADQDPDPLDIILQVDMDDSDDPNPGQTALGAAQEFLLDDPEVWEFTPHVKIVPTSVPAQSCPPVVSKVPEAEASTTGEHRSEPLSVTGVSQELPEHSPSSAAPEQDEPQAQYSGDILNLGTDIILPSQLPADIVAVIDKYGSTRANTMLVILLDNSQRYRVSQKQLQGILGRRVLEQLLSDYHPIL